MDATFQALKRTIAAADQAITAENFDALTEFYADDATLVVKPGLNVTGKAAIGRAFLAIAKHFNHSIVVTQGEMQVIQGGDTALVVMETKLRYTDANDKEVNVPRRATYVFRRDCGKWLCVVDNSYGTDLLGEGRG